MAAMLLTLASCSKTLVVINGGGVTASPYCHVPQNSNGEFGIVFGNYSPYTKATSNGGILVGPNQCGYDSFNMYAWKDGAEVMNPYTVVWDNDAWSYENISGQQLQYFDRNSTKYDFIGVISNGTETSTYNEVTVTGVPAFLDNSDELSTPDELLWTSVTVEKANYASPVSLNFKHANAKMYIGFASDRADTEVLDYTPSTPEVPATPDTETYTKKATKFIDELVAGNEVQVGIGFYGINSPKLTKTNPNPLYVGADNTSNGYLAKTWLLSIMDAVNAQFVYYRLDQVNNSTSKTVTTEDWESAASNKNIFMMKLADGVDKVAFAAGNDAFATALKAHQTDWVGGSPAESFWAMFEQAYADGWRVIRINVSDANANQVLVFLSSNLDINTQVCTITPGTPYQPAVTGLDGIRVFSVTEDATNGKNVVAPHTTEATAVVTNACALTATATDDDVITFTKPSAPVAQFATAADITWDGCTKSPSVWYALPVDNPDNGYVVKFSYTYDGVSYYDARVHIPYADSNFAQGVYYTYVIYITSKTNGTTDSGEATADKDEVDTNNVAINFAISVTEYSDAGVKKYILGE